MTIKSRILGGTSLEWIKTETIGIGIESECPHETTLECDESVPEEPPSMALP